MVTIEDEVFDGRKQMLLLNGVGHVLDLIRGYITGKRC